ncbi:MAG: PQQ-binding-like beta-propeller repeat protein [Acidobacteriota bacterium]
MAGEGPLPVRWSDDDVTWRARLRGTGVSSPIVQDSRAIVTYQLGRAERRPGDHPTLTQGGGDAGERVLEADPAGEELAFAVAAFDRGDGALLWEHVLPPEGPLPPVHDKHNLASSSPVTDGERVYAWFATGQLLALNLETGEPVWERHLGQEYGPFEIVWGHSSSPALHGGTLFLLCDHKAAAYLLALDARTGEERWRADRGSGMRSYSTPLVVDGPDGSELVVNSSERLDAYDPATGERLWHAGGPNRFPVPAPTHADGIVYTSRGYRSGPYMALRTGGRGDVDDSHVLWRVPTGAPYVSSILHYRGHVYLANGGGVLTVVDAATGERLSQSRVGGIYSASPAAGDGKVYLFSETGETVVLAAGAEPEVLARNRLPGRILASPAIAAGSLFIRTDDELIRIGD